MNIAAVAVPSAEAVHIQAAIARASSSADNSTTEVQALKNELGALKEQVESLAAARTTPPKPAVTVSGGTMVAAYLPLPGMHTVARWHDWRRMWLL